jgi:hypothetical protein
MYICCVSIHKFAINPFDSYERNRYTVQHVDIITIKYNCSPNCTYSRRNQTILYPLQILLLSRGIHILPQHPFFFCCLAIESSQANLTQTTVGHHLHNRNSKFHPPYLPHMASFQIVAQPLAALLFLGSWYTYDDETIRNRRYLRTLSRGGYPASEWGTTIAVSFQFAVRLWFGDYQE